jgi:ABC-2 type transport system ATP-binding protein
LLPAENLHFFARLYGLSDHDRQHRVEELMHRFELENFANTRVGQLSGGWQQRLHLAVSLIHRPKLLVLDEPTSAVDLEARMDLWRLIEGLRDSGTTILLTSHHLAEAERLCSRVALMRSGKVLTAGSITELLARVPGQAVAKVQSADKQAILQRALDLGWQVRQHADQIRLLLPFTLSLREIVGALEGTQVSAVSVHPVTLEDAYLELVGGSP